MRASVSAWGRPPGWVQPRPTTRPPRTRTAPTAGLGHARPSPRPASASAARICSRSASDLFGLALATELAHEFLEVLGLAEVAIDGREAHIGHLVEAGERVHHHFADDGGRNLALARAFQAPDDAVDDAVEAIGIDRTLAQGDPHRTHHLFTVEGFALTIGLDHRQFAQLHPLEGGEAGTAVRTLPAPADRGVVVRRPRVFHLGVFVAAEGTTHASASPEDPIRYAVNSARCRSETFGTSPPLRPGPRARSSCCPPSCCGQVRRGRARSACPPPGTRPRRTRGW